MALCHLIQCFGATENGQVGFEDGNSITVKVWDYDNSRIAITSDSLILGQSKFSTGEFGQFSIEGSIYTNQQIEIKEFSTSFQQIYFHKTYHQKLYLVL